MSCIWWHLTLILRGSLHCIICSLIHLVCLVWFVDWCCACWLTNIWLVHKNTYLHILCIHILYIWERASLRTTSIQYFHFGVNCTFKEKKRYSQHNDDSVCVCVCVSQVDTTLWQLASMHDIRTLKMKQLSQVQPSLFTPAHSDCDLEVYREIHLYLAGTFVQSDLQ